MRTYTLKEAAKIINVPVSLIKQWEKELIGILEIPRSKQGARLYTNVELDQLIEINQMYQDQFTSEEIRDLLQNKEDPSSEPEMNESEEANSISSEKEIPSSNPNEVLSWNSESFFAAMDQYKHTFLNEVKNEIVKVMQTDVIEAVKREISSGTLNTVKSISDSIYKSHANTIDEMKELSFTIQKNSKETTETYKSLEKTISHQTLETSEEFYTLAKQMAETSEELAHYIDVTNNEISCLNEALEREREYYMEEREQFRQEIRQRELAFQSMLSSYRFAASTKGNKWWKFW